MLISAAITHPGREDGLRRLDGQVGQHSSHPVTDQLRSKQCKDGNPRVHLVIARNERDHGISAKLMIIHHTEP
jgi:hypothetical protein